MLTRIISLLPAIAESKEKDVSAGAVDAVVAGGGGFIGGHLVRELLRQGLTVRSLDVNPFSEWYHVPSDAENLQLDLSGLEASRKAVRGARWVYNFAAEKTYSWVYDNVRKDLGV